MRTRLRSQSPNRPFRVNIVGADGLLRQSLAHLEGRSPLHLLHTPAPVGSSEADAYVVSVRELSRLAGTEPFLGGPAERRPVVLAHGPAEHLRAAFLAGCADYLKEPWDPVELETRLLRVASISRTVAVSVAVGYELWGRTVHLPDGRTVGLSAHEAVVAGLLFGNLGEIVSRRTLAYALWGRQPTHPSRAVDMHVSALRRKLGRDLISCVRGQGYVVSVAHEQPEHP